MGITYNCAEWTKKLHVASQNFGLKAVAMLISYIGPLDSCELFHGNFFKVFLLLIEEMWE